LYDNGENANNQAPSEVAETDIPWTHYTHDKTSNVIPDPEYQYLLSSWSDLNGNVQGHNIFMEVEWDNGSTMHELHASNPYFDNQRGAVPEFVWPSVGNRLWTEGQYIFDCGHPGTPAHLETINGLQLEVHYVEEVRYATEIHPPRALVTYRLNHPTTAVLSKDTTLAPELSGGDWLPVTGGQTLVPVTQADVFVTARGGGAVDHCSLITRHLDAIDGLLSLGFSGFDSCTHTGPIQTINDTNYVFDIYPPGTDYSQKINGLFPVHVPTRDGTGTDVSLQWRLIDHTSEIPNSLGAAVQTLNPILCPIDASVGPPSQTESACPPAPVHPTRLRVILPFLGSSANAFAQSILLGWDDVPPPQDPRVRSFNVRLEEFQVDHNGESFLHDGDWRVFMDIGGQWKYISGLHFDRNSNGDNACNGDSLTDNGDHDCFYFHDQPWTVNVVDGNPVHISVGGFESDSVDDEFCTNFSGCDPSDDAGIALALADNDRLGTLDLELDPGQGYQGAILETTGVNQSGALTFHTPTAGGDGTNYIADFSAEEISPPPPPPASTFTVGTPSYTAADTFVTSATPLTLQTTSTDDVGFQYRFRRDGLALPTFSSLLPFPLHWTNTDFEFGPRSATIFLNTNDGTDGRYIVQYSGQTANGATEPRNTTFLKLDDTPPIITINQPAATQYSHADTLTIDFNADDGIGSGVKSSTAKMDGSTSLPGGTTVTNGLKIDLFSEMTLGTHTFSVNSADNLNNTRSQSVTFSIVVTPDSLEQDVNILLGFGCVDNSGIGNSMISKIEDVKSRVAAGDLHSAINTLSALLNQVQAQAGKHISSACTDLNTNTHFNAAQVLIADIEYLLGTLKTTGISDPILGYVLNAGGSGVNGATLTLLNSSNAVVGTTTTDSTGFYFFPQTGSLTVGANYTVQLTGIPKPYSASTPASQNFTWSAAQVNLNGFVLN
jgi:hypothetical protein